MDYLVNLNLNKNELQNAVIQPLATNPSSPKAGQIFYHSTNKKLNIFDGTNWVPVGTDQVQADWNQTTTTAVDYIKNKPTIPTLQNVFGKVKVGSTTITASTTQDTLEIAGSGVITVTPDSANKKVTISTTAQANVIESVKVNGTALTITSKAVDITAIPLSIVTGADDLKAIEALSGTSGLLKKTAANTWALDTSTYATESYVDSAIEALPEPMVFKGSVGTGGTVTWANLPAAATANEGFTYKVITAHTAETGKPAAAVGDTIISTGSEWIVIPSGDEPSGTVTSVGISNSGLITISGSPITSSGSITIGHGTPSGATEISSTGFYKIKTDAYGHVNGTTAVAKSDITGLVGNATQSADGLMSATDKTTLDSLSAASTGAITHTSLTIAQGQTSVSASGVASKLITYQAYQGGEAVIVDYDGTNFSVASAATSAITIKCVITVSSS